MTTNTESKETTFTPEEARTLEALHRRYQVDHDLLSQNEMARLRFLRWRVDHDRLRTRSSVLSPRHSPPTEATWEDFA